MKLPRVRSTVRRLMVGIATLAVAWSLYLGLGDLLYVYGFWGVNPYDRPFLTHGATALAIVFVGSLMGVVGLTIRWRASVLPGWLNTLAIASLTGATIVAAGLVLGAVTFLAALFAILLAGDLG